MLLKKLLRLGGLAPDMEFEDKNLKAAIKKAAKYLKVPEEKLKYEVLSYGSTGIFGLVGAKKAKIKVVTSQKEKAANTKKAKGEAKAKPPKKTAPPRQREQKTAPEKQPAKPPEKPAEKPVSPPAEISKVTDEQPSKETRDAISKGQTLIQKIVDKITEGATVRIDDTDENIVYHVEGGKTALIIGKRGQTLEAIQYLVDRVINKNIEKRIRFQIDVGGYLENKKANLQQRSLHLAEKVKKTGKPVTVGELNVYDRKIVHMCLKEDRDVRTQSMGSGFYRKLVIFPKKGNGSKKANPK
jgi:spoIIIJ-associated protein